MENKIKNVLRGLEKISISVAKRFWFSILIIFFLVVLLANFLFYKYYILSQNYFLGIKEQEKIVLLDEKKYDAFLKFWEEQKIKNQNVYSKKYLNIFEER